MPSPCRFYRHMDVEPKELPKDLAVTRGRADGYPAESGRFKEVRGGRPAGATPHTSCSSRALPRWPLGAAADGLVCSVLQRGPACACPSAKDNGGLCCCAPQPPFRLAPPPPPPSAGLLLQPRGRRVCAHVHRPMPGGCRPGSGVVGTLPPPPLGRPTGLPTPAPTTAAPALPCSCFPALQPPPGLRRPQRPTPGFPPHLAPPLARCGTLRTRTSRRCTSRAAARPPRARPATSRCSPALFAAATTTGQTRSRFRSGL